MLLPKTKSRSQNMRGVGKLITVKTTPTIAMYCRVDMTVFHLERYTSQ